MDGSNVTGTITVPNTTGWQKWQTVTTTGVALSAGNKKMKIYFDSGDFNINFVNTILTAVTSTEESAISETSNKVFPNPVDQTSTVHFYLNESSDTKVELLDAKGREVLLLSNQFMEAGAHELTLSRGALPKGLYFCKISGGKDLVTLKVVVE